MNPELPDNNTYQDTAAVTVLAYAQLDTLLKAKWESMKTALLAGDIETALTYFIAGNQSKYRKIFMSTDNATTQEILSDISYIEVTEVYGKVASGGIICNEAGGTYSYPLVFIQDSDGIWKILGF